MVMVSMTLLPSFIVIGTYAGILFLTLVIFKCHEMHVLLLSRPVICEEVQALLSSIHEDGAATSSMDGDNNLTI